MNLLGLRLNNKFQSVWCKNPFRFKDKGADMDRTIIYGIVIKSNIPGNQ